MSDKNVKVNLWVGFYSLIILVISSLFIIFFLGKANPFQDSITLVVNFKNVEGLKVGSDVKLEGLSIGRVMNIRISKDKEMKTPIHQVVLRIAKKPEYLQWITDQSTFQIVSANFFGDKHIEVSFATKGESVSDGEVLQGTESATMQDIFANVQEITKKADNVIQQVGDVTAQVDGPGLMLTFASLQQTLANVSSLTKRIKAIIKAEGEGEFKIERTLANIDRTSDNLAKITKRVDGILEKDAGEITASIAKFQKAMKNVENVSQTIESQLGGKKGKELLVLLRKGVQDFASTSKNLAEVTGEMKKSLSATNKQNVNLAKTMKDLQVGAENLRKITERILATMDAPNNFFKRIFGGDKKKKKD